MARKKERRESSSKIKYLGDFLVNKRLYVILFSLPLFLIINYSDVEFLWLKVLIAEIVSFLLNVSGVASEQYSVFVKTQLINVEIIRDCTGWKSLFVLFVLILMTPVSKNKKITGMIMSVPFVFFISVFRIYSSIMLFYKFGLDFSLIHDILWQIGLVAGVIGFWSLWYYHVRI